MNPYIIILILLAIAGAFGAGEFDGQDRAHTKDIAATETLMAQAAAALATETEKTRAVEQSLQKLTNAQNLKDADHEKTVADLYDRLRRAAGPTGRLRDPHAATGCGASGSSTQSATASPANNSPADGAETGGLLSAELTGLLERLQSEADSINNAYASCRAQAVADREPH